MNSRHIRLILSGAAVLLSPGIGIRLPANRGGVHASHRYATPRACAARSCCRECTPRGAPHRAGEAGIEEGCLVLCELAPDQCADGSYAACRNGLGNRRRHPACRHPRTRRSERRNRRGETGAEHASPTKVGVGYRSFPRCGIISEAPRTAGRGVCRRYMCQKTEVGAIDAVALQFGEALSRLSASSKTATASRIAALSSVFPYKRSASLSADSAIEPQIRDRSSSACGRNSRIRLSV